MIVFIQTENESYKLSDNIKKIERVGDKSFIVYYVDEIEKLVENVISWSEGGVYPDPDAEEDINNEEQKG